MTDKVADITRGLDDVTRHAVLRANGWTPAFALSADHIGYDAARACRKSGLFDRRMGGAQCLVYRLNDLGLAIQAHLRDAAGGGGFGEDG